MAEPIVMNPQHPVESHFREFLQPQHNNAKARYDKFESSKLIAEKDNNELLHKRIQNSKAKKVSSQHMGKSKDFPLEPYMVPPQFQRNYYVDQFHHPPHHNLQPFYQGHVPQEKMQPTILPTPQHDNKLQNGYSVGLHQQQSNSSPLHHDVKLQQQDTPLETKSEVNTGKRPPSPTALDNNAKKANFDLDTSQEKEDELDKILPLSLIMGDKWAELGTELNLEMFNDGVWDKSMEKPSSPEAKEVASNSTDKPQQQQQPQPLQGSIINGIKTENEPSPLSKIPPPNVTIGGPPTSGTSTPQPAPTPQSAPTANRSRSTSLNSPQLINNTHTLQGNQQNSLKKEQQSPLPPNPQQHQQMTNNMSQQQQQQQMVNQQQLNQQQLQQQQLQQQQQQQLNHHHHQQHLMIQKQQQQQLQNNNTTTPHANMAKHAISSHNNMVSIGSMVTTSPALAHRTKAANGQYIVQNPRSPLTQMGQQPGKMSHGNPTSPLTAVSHPTGHPPTGHPPTGHPPGTQQGHPPPGHPNGPASHPTQGHPPGHPTGPPGHPTGPPGHPTGPPGHPTGPPGHPTGPPGHPVSQDTSMLNRSSVPNVTVTTGYRPNGSTPEEDRMATVQRQQVKNALHQKIKENALQGQNNKQKLQNEELHRVQSFGAASVSLPQNLVPARFNNPQIQQGQYPGNMMSGHQGYPGYDRNYHYILQQQQQQQHMMQQQQLYYQQMRGNDPNHPDHQGMPGWDQGMTQQQYIQRQQMIQHQQQMRLQQQAMYQQQGAHPTPPHQQQGAHPTPPVAKTDGLTSKSEGDMYNRNMGMQSRNVVCTLPQQRQQLHPNSPPIHHPQHPSSHMMPNIQYNNMLQQQQQQQQLGMNQHHMTQQPRHISPQQQQQLLQHQQMNGIPPRGTAVPDSGSVAAHPTLNDVRNNQMMPKGPIPAQYSNHLTSDSQSGPNPTSAVSSPSNKELPESPFNPSLFNTESEFTQDIDSFLQGFDMSTFDR